MLVELFLILQSVHPCINVSDRYVWWKYKTDFSVKASYKRILDDDNRNGMVDVECANVLNRLWKTKSPSKVLIFGWRLILNKLSTIMKLVKQGVLVDPFNLVCPLCFEEEGDLDYLSGECPISKLWWRKTYDWFWVELPNLSGSIIPRLQALEFSTKSTFKIETYWLFRLALCWSIWACRNVIFFKGRMLRNFDGVGMIKLIA